ncbi:hypothetical protein BJX76DRAFT_62727 [Aspergillus varians]
MARMWMQAAFFVLLISGLALADTEPCGTIANLPQCAQRCLSSYAAASNCSDTKQPLCAAEYTRTTSCYEDHCDLHEYLYAMNTTNTLCDIAPRDRRSTQIAVGSSFIALTMMTMALRLVGRPPFSASFWVDDWIALITFVCTR